MEVILNAVCNIIICVTICIFMVFIFAKSAKMTTIPVWEQWMIKVGLAVTACGSLFNFLTLSNPPTTELILNVGLAIVFTWGVLFHYRHFAKKKIQQKKDSK